MAREGLAAAARIARWAGGTGSGGHPNVLRTAPGGLLTEESTEQAAAALDLSTRQVRADWDTARLAGLIEVHGDSARAGWRLRAWDRDDSAVLRGWVALFDAWSLVHPAPAGLAPAVVSEVIEAVPQLLSVLQLSQGPVPLSQLLDLLGQRVTELRDERCEIPYGPRPEPVPVGTGLAPLLDWALGGLAAVGALTLEAGPGSGPGPGPGSGSGSGKGSDSGKGPDSDEDFGPGKGLESRQATMTPLGSWAVWVKLEQIIVAAQSPAGNIEQGAEDMLRGCARLRPGVARDEYRAWLAARPVGSAVSELLDAARGDDSLLRGLAFEALRVVGAPAEAEVRAAADELLLRPYALIWLAEQEGCDPEDVHSVLTREESTWLWVDTAAAVADHGEASLLVRHLEAAVQPTVPQLLSEVRSAGHPRTVQVLVALAAAHPDPALAKAVRRAAFQVHTGGA